MPKEIIAQEVTELQNGPVWIDEAGEWAVYLDGEHIGWASTELAADSKYIEALVTRRAHALRCPEDVWADTYGLEAIA